MSKSVIFSIKSVQLIIVLNYLRMGSQQSFEPPTDHPRFSYIQISSHQDQMLINIPLQSATQEISKWQSSIKLYHHIYSNPAIFHCNNFWIEGLGACSDKYSFIGKFNGVFQSNLKEQIQKRGKMNKYYTQEELWYFLLFLSKIGSEIYQYGQRHCLGNPHPYNILINNKGDYSLIVTSQSYSMPGLKNNFQQYKAYGADNSYVSPELLGFVSSKKYSNYPLFPSCINKRLSQSFCIGLSLLSMATLSDKVGQVSNELRSQHLSKRHKNSTSKISETSICFNNFQNPNEVQEIKPITSGLMQRLRGRYSRLFYEIIIGLIKYEPNDRAQINQIYQEIIKAKQKNIRAFDSRWILMMQQNIQGLITKQHSSKQICNSWARQQSYILKQTSGIEPV